MSVYSRLKELYSQNHYNNTFSRCNDCVNFKSYYFDEFDSDAWCDLDNDLDTLCCYDFKKKN